MSTDKGYVKIYRDVRDHWIWKDDKEPVFDRFHAWVDLIMMVNHREREVMFDGRLTRVDAGSRITSLRDLANRWGWSRHKVSDFLDELEKAGMITQVRDSRKTLVNLVNYGFYQGSNGQSGTLKGHSSDTEGTPKGRPRTQTIHYKDINEGIENNEEGYWTLPID